MDNSKPFTTDPISLLFLESIVETLNTATGISEEDKQTVLDFIEKSKTVKINLLMYIIMNMIGFLPHSHISIIIEKSKELDAIRREKEMFYFTASSMN